MQSAWSWLHEREASQHRLAGWVMAAGLAWLILTSFLTSRFGDDRRTVLVASLADFCSARVGGRSGPTTVEARLYQSDIGYFVSDDRVESRGWQSVGVVSCDVVPRRYGLWFPSLQFMDRSIDIRMDGASTLSPSDYGMIRAEFYLFLPRRTEHRPKLANGFADDFAQGDSPLWRINWLFLVGDVAMFGITLAWFAALAIYVRRRFRTTRWSDRLANAQCPICEYALDPAHVGCPDCGWLRTSIR